MSWVLEELSGIQLNDKRLDKRSKEVLAALSKNPSQGIPSAFSCWSELSAAYQFISNKKVTPEKIIAPHINSTIERIKQHNTVLMPQDTTELNYASHHKKQGIGPIHTEKAKGMLLHPTLALTTDKVCLGIVDDYSWYRESISGKKDHKNKPIEDKESYRWLLSYRACDAIAQQSPDTRIINIADREGDIYEFFQETSDKRKDCKAHWIIRSAQNRLLEASENGEPSKLWEHVKAEKSVAEIEFEIKERDSSDKRKVKQEIKYKRVQIKCPKTKNFEPVELTIVIATEIDPPEGSKGIEWILLTSLDVNTAEEALEVVDFYLCRWQIEIYFKVLKSGCSIEKRQFVHEHNLNVCIRLYMIIAWRILYLTMLSRSHPEISCDAVFEVCEWQSVYAVVKKGVLPKAPPSVGDMMTMVAQLGGYIKKPNSNPGVKTIWLGFQRMHDFALAWSSFQTLQGEELNE